jgi:hypothetical protein
VFEGGSSESLGCEGWSARADSAGGGDTGSSSGAGGHAGGEAGACSSGAGGNSVGEAVKESSEREGEDGENASGEARQDGGESRRYPSPSTSRNSSTSLRRFRVLLAGSVVTSGEYGVGASPAGAATSQWNNGTMRTFGQQGSGIVGHFFPQQGSGSVG